MTKLIDSALDGLLIVLIICIGITAILGIWFGILAVFSAYPTGYYIEASESGYVSQVYQNIKYGKDRLVFTGPNTQAWEAYFYMTKPEPESLYKTL